jgi:histidine ammonia-lyase
VTAEAGAGRHTDSVIELGTGTLTCEEICAIARDGEAVGLDPRVASRLADGHRAVMLLATQGPVYGRSTGVGALLTARLVDTSASGPGVTHQSATLDHGDGLLRSHATTAGPALPGEQVRAMTAARIEQIAVGRSGLGPATAVALVDLLNEDRMPTIGRFNSLGTGDVAPLARLALTLPTDALDSGDGLALMSSNALTIGRAALAVVDLDRLLAAATVVTALTFLARDGAAGALHALAAGPFPGPRRVAHMLRRLGAGSRRPARLQDQYGLRAAPQTLGIAVDAAATLREVVTALAGAGLENPLVIAGPQSSVVHHGGFHAVHLTAALDDAALGLARAAVGSVNRLALLTEPPPTPVARSADQLAADPVPQDEARAFLAGGPATASGIMVLEYTAAAALGTVRAAAIPAATQTAGLSRGIEQDATYAPLAADQLADAIAAMRVLVAVELVAATRALRLRELPVPEPLSEVWRICARLPAEMNDRDLTDDVHDAEAVLEEIAPFGASAGHDTKDASDDEDGLL